MLFGFFCEKFDLKIIWKSLGNDKALNHLRWGELEYAVRLQVVKILSCDAEHLMDYLSLVVIQIDPSNGHVLVGEETPEPIFPKKTNLSSQNLKKWPRYLLPCWKHQISKIIYVNLKMD